MGIRVAEKRLEEMIEVPIEAQTAEQLRRVEDDNNSTVRFIGRKVIQGLGTPRLLFDQPDHWSPDLYLGVK